MHSSLYVLVFAVRMLRFQLGIMRLQLQKLHSYSRKERTAYWAKPSRIISCSKPNVARIKVQTPTPNYSRQLLMNDFTTQVRTWWNGELPLFSNASAVSTSSFI